MPATPTVSFLTAIAVHVILMLVFSSFPTGGRLPPVAIAALLGLVKMCGVVFVSTLLAEDC